MSAEKGIAQETGSERERPQLPDDWWLTFTRDDRVPVIFQDKNGEVERIEATGAFEDNLFELKQTPLRVDGISYYDCIEVKWENGDLTPIFDRVNEKGGYGTVRVQAGKLSQKDEAKPEAQPGRRDLANSLRRRCDGFQLLAL
ncbi:MAG TPA: DUF4265 domain-containing protein [Pyrinomonadaceae bacterium]|nr:DUF4265 domain-containing protein [Pyrinomonadaceae bacterium]